MASFLLRRTLLLLPVLWGVTVVIFLALHLAPGNAAQLLLGPLATPKQLQALELQLGLDQPLPVQYLSWMGQVLRGDLGFSISYHTEVSGLVLTHLRDTLVLAGAAFVLATVIGMLLGIVSALFLGRLLDHLINIVDFLGLAMPVFWLSLIFILFFGLHLHWFPTRGMYGVSDTSLLSLAQHLVLPAVALAAAPGAVIAQITRVALIGELNQLYVKVARAKGLSKTSAILGHALRNASIPIVTTLGLEINYIIGGDVLVENVFNWPGVGQLLVQSVLNRDYPVVLGASLLLAVIFVLVNLLTDALYPLFDPRVEVHG
jgi:peptide/nickel transport system permease protein